MPNPITCELNLNISLARPTQRQPYTVLMQTCATRVRRPSEADQVTENVMGTTMPFWPVVAAWLPSGTDNGCTLLRLVFAGMMFRMVACQATTSTTTRIREIIQILF